MNGLKEVLPPVSRITYFEDNESLDLTEEEKTIDEKRVEEELEILVREEEDKLKNTIQKFSMGAVMITLGVA